MVGVVPQASRWVGAAIVFLRRGQKIEAFPGGIPNSLIRKALGKERNPERILPASLSDVSRPRPIHLEARFGNPPTNQEKWLEGTRKPSGTLPRARWRTLPSSTS